MRMKSQYLKQSQVVKCKVCNSPAIARIRYAKINLCSKHFSEFIERKVRRTIKRYKLINEGDKVLIAISGGKDSTALLTILAKLSKIDKFEVIPLHIDLGINEYSEKSKEAVLKLVNTLGMKLVSISLSKVLNTDIPTLARKLRRPTCSVCGVVKRYIINAVAKELKVNKVALGHNADDIIAYTFKAYITQNLESISKLGPKTESINDIAIGRIRPLYEVTEKETLIYVLTNNLPYLHEECPFVSLTSLEFKIKEMFGALESDMPGIKISYLRNLVKNLKFYPEPKTKLGRCKVCGLISSNDICSFCKLTKKALGFYGGPKIMEYIRNVILK